MVEKDGRSIGGFDDDVFDVLDRRSQTHRAHDVFLGVLFNELRADVEIVGFDLFDDVVYRHSVAQQGVGINYDVKLFLIAADAQNLGDAGHGLQVEFD